MQMRGLRLKQLRFVHEYLVDANAAAAAVRAGYGRAGARVAAHRLLRNANVCNVIAERQAADVQRLRLERQDVINGLLEAIEEARVQCNSEGMISGWREVGRMLGFYEPERRQVAIAAGSDLWRLEAMSDSELLAVIEGGSLGAD